MLVHGTAEEGKETLSNQVMAYLIDSGAYSPDREKTFVPSPVNRLDHNTTGLVIFGKNAEALRSLSRMMGEKGFIRKYYLAIVHGEMKEEILLRTGWKGSRSEQGPNLRCRGGKGQAHGNQGEAAEKDKWFYFSGSRAGYGQNASDTRPSG